MEKVRSILDHSLAGWFRQIDRLSWSLEATGIGGINGDFSSKCILIRKSILFVKIYREKKLQQSTVLEAVFGVNRFPVGYGSMTLKP